MGQHRVRLAPRRRRGRRDSRPRHLRDRLHGASGIRSRLSGAALRRNAPARVHRAHPGAAAAAHFARRAVRRARPADPAADGRRAAAAVARDARDRAADHPRDRRSRDAGGPGRRDVGATGALHRADRDRLARLALVRDRRRGGVRQAHRSRVVEAARRIAARARAHRGRARRRRIMSKVARAQLAVILGGVALLELLTRAGVIGRLTMIPPSEMAAHLGIMLEAGELNAPMTQTFANVAIAFALAVSIGCLAGVAIHRLPRLRRLADPLLASYYAVPFFVFYPLLIAMLGLNRWPLIAIGFAFAVAAMMIATLNGLDHAIAYAYDSFDNQTMYALMLFVVVLAIALNSALHVWEQRLMARRRRA